MNVNDISDLSGRLTDRHVARLILKQFAESPGQARSANEIARSWLNGADAGHVSSALLDLQRSGVLIRLGGGDSETFFASDPLLTEALLQDFEGGNSTP